MSAVRRSLRCFLSFIIFLTVAELVICAQQAWTICDWRVEALMLSVTIAYAFV